MYDLHCNYIKTNCGDKAKLFFTETDSLAYEIKTEFLYKISAIAKLFDTSDYETNLVYKIKTWHNGSLLRVYGWDWW